VTRSLDDERDAVATRLISRPRALLESLSHSAFLLLLPVLVFNLVFARHLPPAFQSDVFWKDVPWLISVPENGLRIAVLVLLPLLMQLDRAPSRRRLAGQVLYAFGLVVYCSSWVALIAAPESAWSTSTIGFLAPAWTTVFWFVGLGLWSSETLVLRSVPFRRWIFFAGVAGFLTAHCGHAALIALRVHGG
jgi:hypothetical protein